MPPQLLWTPPCSPAPSEPHVGTWWESRKIGAQRFWETTPCYAKNGCLLTLGEGGFDKWVNWSSWVLLLLKPSSCSEAESVWPRSDPASPKGRACGAAFLGGGSLDPESCCAGSEHQIAGDRSTRISLSKRVGVCLWYVGSSRSTKPLLPGPQHGIFQAPLSSPRNENEPIRLNPATQWRLEGSLSRGFMFVRGAYSGLNFLDCSHIWSVLWPWRSNLWATWEVFSSLKWRLK